MVRPSIRRLHLPSYESLLFATKQASPKTPIEEMEVKMTEETSMAVDEGDEVVEQIQDKEVIITSVEIPIDDLIVVGETLVNDDEDDDMQIHPETPPMDLDEEELQTAAKTLVDVDDSPEMADLMTKSRTKESQTPVREMQTAEETPADEDSKITSTIIGSVVEELALTKEEVLKQLDETSQMTKEFMESAESDMQSEQSKELEEDRPESLAPTPESVLPKTALNNFEDHIWNAYDKHVKGYRAYTGPKSIFPGGRSMSLRKDEVNRILFYPGAFNPPHIGHYEHIKHMFTEAQYLLNLVACFTVPRDDKFVDKKFRNKPDKTIIKANRAKLWKQHEPALPWNWVFEGSEDEFDDCTLELEKTLKAEGYRIEFICAMGPDYVTVEGGTISNVWGGGSSITSDICRKADFVGTRGRLIKIKGCDEWENFKFDKVLMSRKDEKDYALAATLLQRMAQQVYKVKVCRQTEKPEKKVYFVPKNSRAKEYSSTELRALINLYIGDTVEMNLRNKLEGVALSPCELSRIVRAAAKL